MYQLETPQRINKSFSITQVVEKQAITQNDMIIEDQYIEVSGYASRMYKDGEYVIDADQENVNTFGFDLKRLANGTMPLLFNHKQDQPVGKVLEATYDAEGLLIKAKLFKYKDDQLTNFVYNSVKNGVITAFSVGMLVKDFDLVEQDGDEYLQLSKSEVIEVSLVAVPSNPEALFRIYNMKSVGEVVTLLEKSAIKPENPNACSGFECAIKSIKQEQLEEQKEIEVDIKEVEETQAVPEDKEVVVSVTPEAMDKLEEISNPAAPVEDTKPTEGVTVTPNSEDTDTDKGNDKPSENPQVDLEQKPEDVLHSSLQHLASLDVANLSDDEMEQVYEAVAPIIDKINERVVASIADAMRESMTISAPAE